MKPLIILLLVCCTGLSLWGQKTIHDPMVAPRTVSSFHSIEVSAGIDLYLTQGPEAVAVSGKDEKSRDRIRTEVKDGVLKIYYDWKDGVKIVLGGGGGLKAYVSVTTLKRLSASGGADVHIEGTLSSPSLEIHASGGVDLKGKLNVTDLKAHLSGGSDMQLSGIAKNLIVEASGGSDFEGYGLQSEVCYAEASGASDISITVSKELTAEATGGSDVDWKGQAALKKVHSSGGSSISHRS